MKLYADADDFAAVYPFIPYQFRLLASVLTSIRTHGASGKHLSEGERSMRALFKESVERRKDRTIGALIPFYLFYDALENFLDAAHSRVIRQALDNSRINPEGVDEYFNDRPALRRDQGEKSKRNARAARRTNVRSRMSAPISRATPSCIPRPRWQPYGIDLPKPRTASSRATSPGSSPYSSGAATSHCR